MSKEAIEAMEKAISERNRTIKDFKRTMALSNCLDYSIFDPALFSWKNKQQAISVTVLGKGTFYLLLAGNLKDRVVRVQVKPEFRKVWAFLLILFKEEPKYSPSPLGEDSWTMPMAEFEAAIRFHSELVGK